MVVRLSAREYGAGSPVLILHGLFGSRTNWQGFARQLASAHRVIVPDLRNHGSSPHAEGMTYPELAEDVRALMGRLGLASAALLGHSMGGKVAMALALAQPGVVERLIALDIAPVVYRHDYTPLIDALLGLELGTLGDRREAEARLAAAIPSRPLRQFLLQNLRHGPGGYDWRIDLRAIRAALSDLLGFPGWPAGRRYAGPALFLAGERSDYLRPEHQGRILELFPAARVERVARAGHWLHAERAEEVLERVRAFLADGEPMRDSGPPIAGL
jgi:pimeloyl-ACP methyl ester carboxylesterase